MFPWKRPSSNISVLVLILGLCSVSLADGHKKKKPKIYKNDFLVLYFGAFDYVAFLKANSLKNFGEWGYLAQMATGFPTTAVAVQFSMSTGVYAKDHGVYYDPFLDFKTQNWLTKDDEAFYKQKNVDPIWTVNELAGRKTACINWLGAHFEFSGVKCTYLQQYKPDSDLNEMASLALDYLLMKEDHPNLILLYYDKSRQIGEDFGPHSYEFNAEIEKIEEIIVYFYKLLLSQKRLNSTNLVIVGDSGLLPFNYYEKSAEGVDWQALLKAEKEIKTFQVQTPIARFITHYRETDEPNLEWVEKVKKTVFGEFTELKTPPSYWWTERSVWGDELMLAAPGSYFYDVHAKIQQWKKKYPQYELQYEHTFGLSGYSNAFEKMRGLFLGIGPDFPPSSEIEEIDVVDIKDFVLRKMGISPSLANLSKANGHEGDNLKLGLVSRTMFVLNFNLFALLVN